MVKLPQSKNPLSISLPGSAAEKEEQIIEQVDPSLRHEECGFVLHYLRLAGMLLSTDMARGPTGIRIVPEKTKSAGEERRLPRKRAA